LGVFGPKREQVRHINAQDCLIRSQSRYTRKTRGGAPLCRWGEMTPWPRILVEFCSKLTRKNVGPTKTGGGPGGKRFEWSMQ